MAEPAKYSVTAARLRTEVSELWLFKVADKHAKGDAGGGSGTAGRPNVGSITCGQ